MKEILEISRQAGLTRYVAACLTDTEHLLSPTTHFLCACLLDGDPLKVALALYSRAKELLTEEETALYSSLMPQNTEPVLKPKWKHYEIGPG